MVWGLVCSGVALVASLIVKNKEHSAAPSSIRGTLSHDNRIFLSGAGNIPLLRTHVSLFSLHRAYVATPPIFLSILLTFCGIYSSVPSLSPRPLNMFPSISLSPCSAWLWNLVFVFHVIESVSYQRESSYDVANLLEL
jgi:hypothetical protein